MFRSGPLVPIVCVVSFATCSARCDYSFDEAQWEAQLGYGLGGSLRPQTHPPEFRHHLDLAIAAGAGEVEPRPLGCWLCSAPTQGPLLGLSGTWGFGASPSTLMLDGGWGQTDPIAAFGLFLEGGVRLDQGTAALVGTRAHVHLAIFEVGVRNWVSLEGDPDVTLFLVVGVGRNSETDGVGL